MNNSFKKKLLATVLTCTMSISLLLTGCEKGGAQEAEAFNFSFKGVSFNLEDSFKDIAGKAVTNNLIVFDALRSFAYDENGEKDAEKKLLYLTDADKESALIAKHKEGSGESLTCFLADDTFGTFSKYKFSGSLTCKSKATDLPAEFVDMTSYNFAYATVIKDTTANYLAYVEDGKLVELSERIAALPKELSDEDVKNYSELRLKLGRFGRDLMPDGAQAYDTDWQKEYKENAEFRNVCAVLLALSDGYSKLESGEIKSIGTISYSFKGDEMQSGAFKALTLVPEE